MAFREDISCIYGEEPEGAGCRLPPDADDENPTMPDLEFTQIVTWKAPRSEGVEILVYGVTTCPGEPAEPRPGASGPCLLAGTKLEPSVRVLLATAPASAGRVSWSWRQQTPGCSDVYPLGDPAKTQYRAVVVRARSASGDSSFAIAEPGEWERPAPGDQVC